MAAWVPREPLIRDSSSAHASVASAGSWTSHFSLARVPSRLASTIPRAIASRRSSPSGRMPVGPTSTAAETSSGWASVSRAVTCPPSDVPISSVGRPPRRSTMNCATTSANAGAE